MNYRASRSHRAGATHGLPGGHPTPVCQAIPHETESRRENTAMPNHTGDGPSLEGKVALVTGGTRGLGRERALDFARAGADVLVASRKQEACDETAKEIARLGRRALGHACHVGRWGDVDALAEVAYEQF